MSTHRDPTVPAADSAGSGPSIDPGRAWAPYQPTTPDGWDARWAGHLCRRAGFGGNADQLRQTLADGPQRAVDRLLQPEADLVAFNREQDRWEASASSVDLMRAWWLRRMIQTPQPLLEKMTLFWHSYFGISAARMASPSLMARHVQGLRSHALGKFDALLTALVEDPAFLLGLEAGANRKAQPSEHAARVWLECYTVGPGNFSQQDVRELSRALTGWMVLRGETRFVEREHDEGEKQLLGQRGKFQAQEALRVLLKNPATSKQVVKRLYRWFISEVDEPTDALVTPLAQAFAQDYDVAKLVGILLRSQHFFSTTAYRCRVKSPIELAVGMLRSCEGLVETLRLGQDLAAVGQNLYHPPTVHGWAAGEAWINPAMITARQNLAASLLSDSGPYAGKLDLAAVAGRHGSRSPATLAKFLVDLWFQADLPDNVRAALFRNLPSGSSANGSEANRWLRQFAHRLAALPEFQLA